MRRPYNGYYPITSTFQQHMSDGRASQAGVDYGLPTGTPLYAVVSGIMYVWVDPKSGNARGIDLQGNDGRLYKYVHLSSFARGDGKVNEGDLVGYSGATGNVTGPHLCFAVKQNGVRIDAELIFNGLLSQERMFKTKDKVILTKESIGDSSNGILQAFTGTVGIIIDGPRTINGESYYDIQCSNGTGWVNSMGIGLTDQSVNAIGPDYTVEQIKIQEQNNILQASFKDLSEQVQILKDNMANMQSQNEKQISSITNSYKDEINRLETLNAQLSAGVQPVIVVQDVNAFSRTELVLALLGSWFPSLRPKTTEKNNL